MQTWQHHCNTMNIQSLIKSNELRTKLSFAINFALLWFHLASEHSSEKSFPLPQSHTNILLHARNYFLSKKRYMRWLYHSIEIDQKGLCKDHLKSIRLGMTMKKVVLSMTFILSLVSLGSPSRMSSMSQKAYFLWRPLLLSYVYCYPTYKLSIMHQSAQMS